MAEVVGSYGLIEGDLVTWKIAAGVRFLRWPVHPYRPGTGLVPMDLTGYTAACEVRTRAGETVPAPDDRRCNHHPWRDRRNRARMATCCGE